ncbi:MAG: TonB-dependent receptor [Bacteroidota bacterium]
MLKSGFLVVLVLLSLSGWSQSTISGKVIEEESGETLPYATVALKSSGKGVSTNQDGFFTLLNVSDADSILVVSYVGYESKEVILTDDVRNKLLIIGLSVINEQLDEVVVSAQAYKVLNATSGISSATISTKQLSLLPSIGETDIFRSLQLLPGVSGTNENSSGLFVRGGTPDQNLVLLDGMTVYKVDHFFGFFSAFNANAVKDVQLYKGAFPAKYGGRTSSVVDMTGKTGSFNKFQGGANVNFLSVNGYIEVPVSDKFSFLLAGRRSYTDVIRSNVFTNITDNLVVSEFDNIDQPGVNVTEVQPDFYFFDWNGKFSYRPNEKDLFTISLYNGRDFLDESRDLTFTVPNQQLDTEFDVIIKLDEITEWGNKGGSAKWSRQWSPKLYSNVLIAGSEYFSTYDRDGSIEILDATPDTTVFFGSAQSFEDNSVRDYSIRADFEWQVSENNKIDFGGSFTQTQIDYTNVRNDTLTILERQQEANYGSIYVSNEHTFDNKLTLSTGVRISDYENSSSLLIEPRVNLSYQLNNKLKLKAAYGEHYQFVNRILNENISEGSRDFWLLADGDLVDVSKATHYIAGISYEVDQWLFDIEGYYKDLRDISEFSLRFRRGIEINTDELFFTGDGIAKGLEFLIQKKSGRYTGWISYTLGSVRHTFEAFNGGQEFPAIQDQLHEFKMLHSIEIDRWTLSSTFVYGSGRPFSEPLGRYNIELLDGRSLNYVGVGPKNGSRLPAYHRLDISAHYKFPIGKHKGDFGISVFNFYNRTNVWYKEYDFSQEPVLVSDITYLGITPNLSFGIQF